MGWNDRNPELYESITGLRYEDDQPIGSPRSMPAGWVPPAMPETCAACNATGDAYDDPIFAGECGTCDADMCMYCGEVEGDYDGNIYTCKGCVDAEV